MAALLTIGGVLTNPGPAAAATLESPATASAIAGRRSIVVSWTAPPTQSGSVLRYRATATSTGDSGSCDLVLPGSLTCTISGLTAGASYTVGVIACPNASTSDTTDCSNPTNAAAPVLPGPPGTPAAPTVTFQGDPNSVQVSWIAPDPGAGILSYRVTPTPSAGLTGTCAALVSTTSCGFTGLVNDTSYTFKVTAIGVANSAGSTGTSSASSASSAVVAGPAHTPANVTATRDSDTAVTVAWDKPSGNQALANYTVTAASDDGGTLPSPCTVTADQTECPITGLDADKSYTFTVEAVGVSPGSGSGASAASDPITPGMPSAPSTPSVDVGPEAGDVTVSWDAPSDGGTVTGYTVTAAPQDGGTPLSPCTVGADVTYCAFTGLQDGKAYKFQVTATGPGGTQDSEWSDAVVSQLPDQPAAPVATLGSDPGTVELSWSAPMGGAPVVYYTVTAIPAGSGSTGTPSPACGFDLTSPSCEITGLDPADSYTFTVTAVGDLGSMTSDPSSSVVPDQPGEPGTPAVALGANPGDVTVTWTAPADGGVVDSYTVTAVPSDGTTPTVGCDAVPMGTTSCAFTSLPTTTSYAFKITASNNAGDSDATPTVAVPDKPDSPQTPSVVLGGTPGTVTVNWTAPGSGTPDRYIVKAASSDGGTLPSPCAVDALTLTCDVTGLDLDKTYTFTVRAENILGGTDAAATAAVVPDKPGAPTAVAVDVSAPGDATVNWSAPATGGETATYTVTATDSDDTSTTPCSGVPAATTTCAITGLDTSKSYTFTVTATNNSGFTDAAATGAIVPDAPGAPTGVAVVLGDAPGKATVTWDAPVGGAVTTYTVTPASTGGGASIPSACTVTPPATNSCLFDTLSPASPYTFTVSAANPVGHMEASPTAEIVPDKPGNPTAVAAAQGDAAGKATVTWDVPADGGAVVSYTVTPASTDGAAVIPTACTVTSTDPRTCTFTTLTATDPYTFTVSATNTAGHSDVSTTPALVPNVPDAPAGVAVTLGGSPGTAVVTWDAATGADVTGWTVTGSSTDGGSTPSSCVKIATDTRSCTFSGLTTSASYTFTVEATNTAGSTSTSTTTAVVPDAPGTPGSVAAVLGTPPGTAVVTWDAPTSGGPVGTYTVTAASADSGATIPTDCTVTPPDDRTCTFDGLDLDKTYTFTVRATNPSGNTDAAPTTALLPDKPGLPDNVAVVLGNAPGKVTITWDAPADGGAVDHYSVTPVSTDGDTTSTACASVPSDTTTCAFTALTADKSYTFTVVAVNDAGQSGPATTSAIVPNQPDVPTGATVTLGVPGTATVTWDAPTGAEVTGWTVTPSSPDGGTEPAPCTKISTDTRSCPFTGLTTIASYTFTVRATNAAGSADSEPTDPVVPNRPNAPGTPTAKVIAADQAQVTWTASAGGGEVTGYSVAAYPVSDPSTPVTSAACTDITGLTCDFDTLSETESYTFRVTATGPGGDVASEPSTAITTAGPGKPDAPAVVPAGPGAVRVTWSAPATGGPVTGYTVTSEPDLSAPARCTNVLVLACVFDRLAAGTAYTFEVVASGTADRTTASDPSASIVPGPPGTPQQPTVATTSNTGEVLVSWAAPTSGVPIAGYRVQSTPGGLGCASPAGPTDTSCVVSGLTPATSYTFRVQAVGGPGSGDSPYGPDSPAITPGAASGPTGVEVAAGDGRISVSWTPPPGAPVGIGHYRAETTPGGFFCETTGNTDTECAITGVQNLTTYTVTVTAVGTDGTPSPASKPSARVRPTAGLPGSPAGVQAVGGDTTAVVSWTAPASVGNGISGYAVTAVGTSGTRSCTTAGATVLTCTLTGLTNGQPYTVTVVSIGRAASGYSAPSTPVTVTSRTAPGTPTAVAVTGGVTTLVVRWTAGSAGDGLSGFVATATGGTAPQTCTAAATATTCSIINVPPGVYSVSVVAKGTQAGITSAPSTAVNGTAMLALAAALPTTQPTSAGTLTVSSATPRIGDTVTVTGTGFAPYTGVTLGLYPGAVRLTAVTTDGAGGFSQDVTIPTSVTAGAKALVAGGLPASGTTVKYRTVAITVQPAP